MEIQPITVRGPDEELEAAFAAVARERADAVVIQGSLSTKRIADLALEHGLPAGVKVDAIDDMGTFRAVMDAMRELHQDARGYETLIIDTLDALEPMLPATTSPSLMPIPRPASIW